MDAATLAEQNGGFYAPAFDIKVAGAGVMQKHGIAVSQVEVDLALGVAGRFSFTVVDAYSLKDRTFVSAFGRPVLELLTFGAEVEIAMGYGDHTGLTKLITGVITEIATTFAETGAPELTVAGHDHLFAMTLGKRSESWVRSRDSDVVGKRAREYNLATDIEPTGEERPQIEQNQESDYDFLKKLAERNHYELYVDPSGKLRFGRPRDGDPGRLVLRWGESLLSFKPQGNLAAQVSKVEVYGWDDQRKRPIVGRASAGEETGHDPRRQSGGERVRTLRGPERVLQVRQPVFSEAEARRRAEAILNDHAKRFLTGDGECLGLPDLLPDRNVDLGNLGDPFSKTYYLQQTTHKVDGSGYRTRFKVKETTL